MQKKSMSCIDLYKNMKYHSNLPQKKHIMTLLRRKMYIKTRNNPHQKHICNIIMKRGKILIICVKTRNFIKQYSDEKRHRENAGPNGGEFDRMFPAGCTFAESNNPLYY